MKNSIRIGIILLTLFFLFLSIDCDFSSPSSTTSIEVPTETKTNSELNIIQKELGFDAITYIPDNAVEIRVQDIDFEGDGQNEKIVLYKSLDKISTDNGVYNRKNEHLKVFLLQDTSWKLIKDDQVSLEKEPGLSTLTFDFVLDILTSTSTKTQALFVMKAGTTAVQNPGTKYYVFGKYKGEYSDFPITKASLQKREYLNNMYLTKTEKEKKYWVSSFDFDLNGNNIVEYLRVWEPGKGNPRFEEPVRMFTISHYFNGYEIITDKTPQPFSY